MHVEAVVVDYIDADGCLSTWIIEPKKGDRVIIDKLSDIKKESRGKDRDIGPIRVYNKDECKAAKIERNLNTIYSEDERISFQFEHIELPVTSGMYYLLLPPGFKFSELHIVDPYDQKDGRVRNLDEFSSEDQLKELDHLRCHTVEDESSKIEYAEMQLRSSHDSFSFLLLGKAELYEKGVSDESIKKERYQQLVHRACHRIRLIP